MRVALERDGGQRLRRLLADAGDRGRQRVHATRPQMRALSAAPGGKLSWSHAPAPLLPGPQGAIVHPIAASTCDLDCPLVLGATQFPLPLHLGHECVAEVLAVGEQVMKVRVGDRVIVPFQISCGACPPCLAGHTGSCASVPPVSMYGFGLTGGHWGGAFSDELAIPYADAMLVALPAGVDPVAAVGVADNICDAYRHLAPHLPGLLERDPDAEVLILAAANSRTLFTPSVPLYAGLIARALGAHNIQLADSRANVRAHAERLGFGALHPRQLRRRPPAPLVVDVSGDALGLALASTAPDGVCSSAGGLHRSARIPFLLMYGRNATLHLGRTHVRALMPEVLELIAQGRLHPETLTTSLAPLDDAPSALREHFMGDGIKTVLTTG
ncbi:MAG TPA: alcohol dehydrogenase catalytic domain-containing protein [Solirubrobacteraceae bacterium]|jgi:alcohol dehydrogenase